MATEDESIPKESTKSLYAKSVFFRQFNDIDFYVEDHGEENLYFLILKKLFPNLYFENIFPLGGKENLINRARSEKKAIGYLFATFLVICLHQLHIKSTSRFAQEYCEPEDRTKISHRILENYNSGVAGQLMKRKELKLHEELIKVGQFLNSDDLRIRNIAGDYIVYFPL